MLEFILVVVYIVLTTAIGWYMSQRAKAQNDIKSFFIGKKELGTMLIMFVMFGAFLEAAGKFVSQLMALHLAGFRHGNLVNEFDVLRAQALCHSACSSSSQPSASFTVSPVTMAHTPSQKHSSSDLTASPAAWSSWSSLLSFTVFSMQCSPRQPALSSPRCSTLTAMTWIMGIIFIIQGLVGLKGIAAMNVVHASVLYVGSVVVGILAWHNVGSLDVVRETLGANYLSVTQPSLGAVIGNAAGGMFAFISRRKRLQRQIQEGR